MQLIRRINFYSENINLPWDGSYSKNNNKNVPIGIYVYIITAKFNGVDRNFEGTINVVYQKLIFLQETRKFMHEKIIGDNKVYKYLNDLNIFYEYHEHPPAPTIEIA